MKNLIIAILLFTGLQANAQYNVPIEQFCNYDHTNFDNHYFKDMNNVFGKFLGNWKYQTATDLVEITIYKADQPIQ